MRHGLWPGPWLDTNLVLPLTSRDVDRCKVVFDYFLDAVALAQAAASTGSSGSWQPGGAPLAEAVQAALQSQFVQDSLASSHQVQVRS